MKIKTHWMIEAGLTLPLILRPKTLDLLIGQKREVSALRAKMASRPPSCFLLHGSPGCGKTSMARIIALSFQCTHQAEWGQPCQACWDNWQNFDIREINASEVNGVDEIGEIVKHSRFAPMPPSSKRVFILDEAQRVSPQAQQLLLKPCEHPGPHTIWIIATTEPNKISEALRRRFTSISLNGLNVERTQLLLKRAAKHIGFTKTYEPLVIELDKIDITSPALILQAFEHYASGHSPKEAVQAVQSAGGGASDTYAMCKAVSAGNWGELQKHLQKAFPDEARWIRSSISGWLKGWLLKEVHRARSEKVSRALLILWAPAPLEDAALFPWLCAALFKICKTISNDRVPF